MQLNVSKYHGCGNDFIIVREEDLAGWDLKTLIPAVCHRNTGIGADGFIAVRTDPLEMVFYNCDGSAAPMCGNGIRCFALYCQEEGLVGGGGGDAEAAPAGDGETAAAPAGDGETAAAPAGSTYTVLTKAGPKTVRVLSEAPFLAEIAMGRPDYRPQAIGAALSQPIWAYPLELDGQTHILYSFFMATDHSVLFCGDPENPALQRAAEKISTHPLFPRQTNVNLVQVVDRGTIKMRTWERGAGLTLACGTGACAAALAAYRNNLCNNKVKVLLPKGTLTITIGEDEEVLMAGPAEQIMKGIYYHE